MTEGVPIMTNADVKLFGSSDTKSTPYNPLTNPHITSNGLAAAAERRKALAISNIRKEAEALRIRKPSERFKELMPEFTQGSTGGNNNTKNVGKTKNKKKQKKQKKTKKNKK
jgi:hypothetical protein